MKSLNMNKNRIITIVNNVMNDDVYVEWSICCYVML